MLLIVRNSMWEGIFKTLAMFLIVWNSNRGDYDGNRVVNLVEFKVGRYLGQ